MGPPSSCYGFVVVQPVLHPWEWNTTLLKDGRGCRGEDRRRGRLSSKHVFCPPLAMCLVHAKPCVEQTIPRHFVHHWYPVCTLCAPTNSLRKCMLNWGTEHHKNDLSTSHTLNTPSEDTSRHPAGQAKPPEGNRRAMPHCCTQPKCTHWKQRLQDQRGCVRAMGSQHTAHSYNPFSNWAVRDSRRSAALDSLEAAEEYETLIRFERECVH